ncbi:outer membrane protein (porin) [secondary endosymbiont of Heteropsylla cubana]|uniref:Outer membrane protein (Porin) n=1 Tax=secondary endosymbiont of Heteropsylla cubana TaxID=134287 RepID=J3TZ35_9ENTR|nr:porin OmpC [secondary endosymbiont of Heteropsylla cubana]AFP85720.1 outer membrane protein (porin) [secondary endosymbiont of Heteropsylla cubana]
MKLQYLSVLVSAMVIAGNAIGAELYNKDGNKLELLGKLNGIRHMSSDDSKNGDRSSFHYGFNGEARLGDGIIGFGSWKQEIGLNQGGKGGIKNSFSGLDFAGLKFSDSSTIDYGRNSGVLYDIGAWTDVMPQFGGDTTISDNFMTGRANSVFTYRNSNFFGMLDGLNFALQYQGKNEIGRSISEANGDGYGLSVTYNFSNGLSAGTAYTSSNRTLSQQQYSLNRLDSKKDNKDKRAEAYSFGVKYDANNCYLAALYSETHNMTPYGIVGEKEKSGSGGFADMAYNFEFVAQYALDFGLRPSIGYLQSRIDGDDQGRSQTIKKYIEVGATYNFNKNMLTFVDYRINLLDKKNFIRNTQISTDNILSMGMTYMF